MSRLNNIKFCGVSDEAGSYISEHIKAHKMLGWDEIELRMIGGKYLSQLNMDEFRRVKNELCEAEMKAIAICSPIGNWESSITGLFERDKEELLCFSERMHSLGSKYLRIMSYKNEGFSEGEWRSRVIERIGLLAEIAHRESIVLVHENCTGWASESAENTLDMIKSVNSSSLRILFDIGNSIAYGYDCLDFLKKVLPWVVHVHIKDGLMLDNGKSVFTFPGDGEVPLVEGLKLLINEGYSGLWSIEPHIHYIPHLKKTGDGSCLWNSYVDYGKRFMEFVEMNITEGR